MNKLSTERQSAVLRALVEGASVRGTARMVGCDRETVLKLLVEVGEFCSTYQYHAHKGLGTTRLEVDEIWAFCGAKARNATQAGHGDIWTFTGIDAESKLCVSWLVGARSADNAVDFMRDVAARLTERVQLTTDGHNMYLTAVRAAFGFARVDYAQLVKKYGVQEPGSDAARRYSPAVCIGCEKERIIGRPDMEKVSTSYVERANLTMRMHMRRFTRLTNAFSKKHENHAAAVALHFMYYNYIRPHQTLTKAAGEKTTPAMAAGLTDRPWTFADVLAKMDPRYLLR